MPATRRQVADDLAEQAHACLAGAPPESIIAELEFRIQDLQEIADHESDDKETEEKAEPSHARTA